MYWSKLSCEPFEKFRYGSSVPIASHAMSVQHWDEQQDVINLKYYS